MAYLLLFLLLVFSEFTMNVNRRSYKYSWKNVGETLEPMSTLIEILERGKSLNFCHHGSACHPDEGCMIVEKKAAAKPEEGYSETLPL